MDRFDEGAGASWTQKQRFASMVDIFTLQVQHGCDNPACQTPTCFTNRQRLSRTPVRKYTSLATVPIALVLAGRNDAEDLICPHLRGRHIPHQPVTLPDRIDTKALMQQLSCTKAVRVSRNIGQGFRDDDCNTSSLVLPKCVAERHFALGPQDFTELEACRSDQWSCEHSPTRSVIKKYLGEVCASPDRLADSLLDVTFPEKQSDPALSLHIKPSTIIRQRAKLLSEYLGPKLLDSLTECLMRICAMQSKQPTFGLLILCIYAVQCFSPEIRTPDALEEARINALTFGLDAGIDDRVKRCALQAILTFSRCVSSDTKSRRSQVQTTGLVHEHDSSLIARIVRHFQALTTETTHVTDFSSDPKITVTTFILLAQILVTDLWEGKYYVRQGSHLWVILDFLQRIHRTVQRDVYGGSCVNLIENAGLNAEEACSTYLTQRHASDERHILSWPFLFREEEQWQCFRTACYIRMREASKDANFAEHSRVRFGSIFQDRDAAYLNRRMKTVLQHYLVLKISRDNLLGHAFDQLWHREHREILRPLRVRLGDEDGEIGVDQGGVQVEFFTLLCEQICAPDSPCFQVDQETNLMWFRVGSLEPLLRYELLGLLFGLALYNGITLPVSFPLAFYKKLMGLRVDVEDLQDGWPTQYKSMQWVMNYQGDDMEDALGMEHTFALHANGLTLDVDMLSYDWQNASDDRETPCRANVRIRSVVPDAHQDLGKKVGKQKAEVREDEQVDNEKSGVSTSISPAALSWPGWDFVEADDSTQTPVSMDNRKAYVESYAQWILDYSIRPQFYAFATGFFHIMDMRTMHLLSPTNLRALVEGEKSISVATLQSKTSLLGYEENAQQIQWFWSIVQDYDQDQLQRLLEFVTASKRMPPGGTGLRFVIQRQLGDSYALPSSSTCFSTLNLPLYTSMEVMKKKLDLALQYSIGFGIA